MGLPLGEAFLVELQVPGLVAQHQLAHLLQHDIGCVEVQEPVVRRADEFGDDEDLDLELDAEGAPEQPEAGMGPVPRDQGPVVSGHQPLEEAGVLLLLGDEQAERLDVVRVVRVGATSLGEEEAALAALAELEV